MRIAVVPALGIILTIFLKCINANLSLDFKVTKILASPANCNVANTTYAHGETFKLDCKTQCVCENGRHACSSLCPKEQLPAPEDTISCRSPRLVEVPGHCCKMWLCENPTADVFATCHNSSTSPWTPCSRSCGLGISTRFTSTTAGCNQLSNLRLCENRKCESSSDEDNTNKDDNNKFRSEETHLDLASHLARGKDKHNHKNRNGFQLPAYEEHHKHKMGKGHECRHIERLGPARIRLGQCVSRKLYRPKVCGHCHHKTKCCVPSVSTTIQVELLCPLNAVDPISFVQRQLNSAFHQGEQQQQQQQLQYYSASTAASLWDTHSLDAIDQEYLQSHQIHIENKFVAVEWILKCVCSESESCERRANATDHVGDNGHSDIQQHIDVGGHDVDDVAGDNRNNENFNKINMQNDNNKDIQNDNYNNDDYNYFGLYDKINKNNYKRQHLQHIDDNTADDNDGDTVDGDPNTNNISGRNKHKKHQHTQAHNDWDEAEPRSTSSSSSLLSSSSSSSSSSSMSLLPANSDEIQPDIIPYPPPPFRANKQTNISNQKYNNGNNNHRLQSPRQTTSTQTAKRIKDNVQQEREQQRQQQQEYFYEQWLLQQQQQERQQAFYENLLVT